MSTQRDRQGSVSRACACGRFAMAATARLYRCCSVIAGLALMLSCGDSNAGDVYWNNSAGGAFTNSANWNPVRVPGSADVVYFTLNNTYEIGFSASYTNGYDIFNAGNVTLNIGSGNTLYVANEFRGSYIAGTSVVTLKSGNLSVANGSCYIGYAGNCTMTISDGLAQLKNVVVSQNSGSVGNWNIIGGTNTLSSTLNIGQSAGSTGTVSMTGGSLSVPNADTSVGNGGNGTMTISNGVAQFKVVYVGNSSGSVGNWNIAGGTNTLSSAMYVGSGAGTKGTVLMTAGNLTVTNATTAVGNSGNGTMTISNGVAQYKDVTVGQNSGSAGTLNIAGGTHLVVPSANWIVGSAAGATGTVNVTGGYLDLQSNTPGTYVGNNGKGTMTISGGTNKFSGFTVGRYAGSTGMLTVIGTNAVITCSTYTHGAATSPTLSELFYNGGVSPITCSGVATLKGVLTLGLNGYMGLLTTDAIPLINAGSFAAGGFGTTNRSVFAVSKTTTKLLATLDSSYRSAGSTLVNNVGLSFSATNQGWVAVSTNGMTGSTFDLNLVVLTNNATHTVSDLVSVLKTAGYTATNSVKSGDEWLTLTLPVADWSNPAFAWDLTGYDPMMSIKTARIGSIPPKGTLISFL